MDNPSTENKPVKRKALSKSKRFRIFARDGFVCRYCGASPPDVRLVVDHVTPVAEGGGDDDTNLITSCESCNSGKGKKVLRDAVPTDADAARLAQEYMEQVQLAGLAQQAASSRLAMAETITNYACEVTGFNSLERRNVSGLVNLMHEFSPEDVFEWIDRSTAATGAWREDKFMMYIYGIARRVREGGA